MFYCFWYSVKLTEAWLYFLRKSQMCFQGLFREFQKSLYQKVFAENILNQIIA